MEMTDTIESIRQELEVLPHPALCRVHAFQAPECNCFKSTVIPRVLALIEAQAARIKEAEADRERLVTDIIAAIQQWQDAYPEDCPVLDGKPIFAPLPPANTESKELQAYRTRASAAMGRHMSKCLIEAIHKIAAREQEKPNAR